MLGILVTGRTVDIVLVRRAVVAVSELGDLAETLLREMGLEIVSAVIIGYITFRKRYRGAGTSVR